MVNSERNLTLLQQAVDPPGEAHARLADHRPGRLRDGLRRRASPTRRRGGLRGDQAASGTRRPATTCAASPTSGCARTPVQWPAPPPEPARRPQPDPLPQRRRQPAAADARTAAGPGWRSPPRAAGPCSSPARTCRAAELPDDDYPFVLNTGRLQHQWHTLTKTGKVAKLNKLNPGPVRRDPPRRRARRSAIADGDRVEVASRRGRAVLPAVVTDRVLPGQLLRAVPLERPLRRVPDRQRRHQRRRRPDLVPAGVQGLRGVADARCPQAAAARGPATVRARFRRRLAPDGRSASGRRRLRRSD